MGGNAPVYSHPSHLLGVRNRHEPFGFGDDYDSADYKRGYGKNKPYIGICDGSSKKSSLIIEGRPPLCPENYKGNAVADAFFRNKLAQPKQNHRAGDHYGNIGELVQEGNLVENSLPLQHGH